MAKNSMQLISMGVLFVLALVLFSGCVNNTSNTSNPANTTTNSTGGYVANTQTDDQMAGSVSGGTGTSSGDISDSDLDSMQSDLDDLDTSVDESQESDV